MVFPNFTAPADLPSPALPLQDRPRRPLPSFARPHPEGHSLGFLLGRGRCTATAQADGGLRDSPAVYWDRGVAPRPCKPGHDSMPSA